MVRQPDFICQHHLDSNLDINIARPRVAECTRARTSNMTGNALAEGMPRCGWVWARAHLQLLKVCNVLVFTGIDEYTCIRGESLFHCGACFLPYLDRDAT